MGMRRPGGRASPRAASRRLFCSCRSPDAPAVTPAVQPPPGSQALLRSELYFGRLKPDGSVVTDAEWRAFVVEHVTPRFPDGFTVLDGWPVPTRAGELKTEPTKIFIVIHPGGAGTRVDPGAPRHLPPPLPAGVRPPDREPRPRRLLTGSDLTPGHFSALPGQALTRYTPPPHPNRRLSAGPSPSTARSPARPPWWARSGHVQTIWGPLFREQRLPLRRERLSTPDGDFVDLDWLDGDGLDANAPRLLVLHGLEGSSRSHYVSGLLRIGRAAGWHGVAFNLRSCSGELNRLRASTFGRDGRSRLGGAGARRARARRPDRRRRRVARGKRAPEVAGRGGRGGACEPPRRGRHLGALRRGRLRPRPRPGLPPPRLRRQLPADDAVQGDREGAAIPWLRRRGGDAPRADLRPLRPGRDRAPQRVSRRGGLLGAGLERPAPAADPPADAPRSRGRPDRARPDPARTRGASRRTLAEFTARGGHAGFLEGRWRGWAERRAIEPHALLRASHLPRSAAMGYDWATVADRGAGRGDRRAVEEPCR